MTTTTTADKIKARIAELEEVKSHDESYYGMAIYDARLWELKNVL